MKTAIAFIPLLVILISCEKDEVTLPVNSSITVGFTVGQERVVTTEGKSPKMLHIQFTDVQEGRCAKENCSVCYGGYVYAYFAVWSDTGQDRLALNRISCVNVSNASFDNPVVDRKDIQGLRIGLATISDPQSSISKYKTQLLISDL